MAEKPRAHASVRESHGAKDSLGHAAWRLEPGTARFKEGVAVGVGGAAVRQVLAAEGVQRRALEHREPVAEQPHECGAVANVHENARVEGSIVDGQERCRPEAEREHVWQRKDPCSQLRTLRRRQVRPVAQHDGALVYQLKILELDQRVLRSPVARLDDSWPAVVRPAAAQEARARVHDRTSVKGRHGTDCSARHNAARSCFKMDQKCTEIGPDFLLPRHPSTTVPRS